MKAQHRLQRQLVEAVRKSLAGSQHPGIPEAGRLLWGWFLGLSATRTSNGRGPNPITFAEIEAYGRVHGWPMRQDHIAILLAMDRAYLEDADRRNGKDRGPAQRLTAEAFDAVFG